MNGEGTSSLGDLVVGDAQRDCEMNRLMKVTIKSLNSRILKESYPARGVGASSQTP